ncbi:hypothetical protein KCP73_07355 [Salmonella enterica subsp. enterica]|nr:hypothetical protein KCP73_07355 [Salmonella enterica subsp. enterica]
MSAALVKYRAAEGKTVKLPLRGPVGTISLSDIPGGLRSARDPWRRRVSPERADQTHHLYSGCRNKKPHFQ